MFRVSILAAAFVAALSGTAFGQPSTAKQKEPPAQREREPPRFGAPAEEMLQRAAIRHEEEVHREMVERADEAAQLSEHILASFKTNNSLSRDDLKRLERLEKLARKIRGGAGGSDDDKELHDPPGRIEGAVTRLAELSGDLKKSVSKTSRLVISAGVIERSNEMIELIRHIRSIQRP